MFETHPISALLKSWSDDLPGARWFVVGGAVRDALLDRPVIDLDILVAGVSYEQIAAFLEERGSLNEVGRTFGVLKFVSKEEDGLALDIALPRRERAEGTGGYRDVQTDSDPMMPIEEDLGRRDFTINAMAWEAVDGHLVDPFGGQDDLKKGLLRAVGDARTRFAEDLTRLLRALRFAVQLDFSIEAETYKALLALMPRLGEERDGQRLVPEELIAREFFKSFSADPVRTARVWQETGAFTTLFPEIRDWPERVQAALERLTQDDVKRIMGEEGIPIRVVFGLCLSNLAPDAAAALAERRKLASAGTGVDAPFLRRLLAGGDLSLYKELGLKPLLEGEAVMRLLGLPSGPDVGRAIDLLLDAQAKGKVSGPSEAEVWLTTHWLA